ncbi:MAG: RidA family protein [Spirochaetales bacterium]|nr:RidA family protein [Spirochaetales bacterium]MBQ3697486.1 RidA family protein [Spirochaetales bacterium]MBQ9809959.1 RidA family protein [Spirochaetales bacterium]
MKIRISTDKAPAAIGPYSQAVKADNLLFVSGQIPIDPASGVLVEGIEAQSHQVLRNIKAILNEAGLDFDSVVKTTVFLKDMGDFQTVNGIYAQYFNGDVLPARCAMQVGALPKNSLIEIECIAFCK